MSLPAPAECGTLNDGQRAALDLDRDLLVDAGAGAGKTRVLALRYLALIEEGRAKVSEVVAFTFTDKAAAEMRKRVQEYLDARIAELVALGAAANIERERLVRARAEFHRNAISTVHGFCRGVLRDWALEAGLEPGAPLMDDREQARARRAAVSRVLQRQPAVDKAALAEALEHLGSVTNLQELSGTLSRMLSERHVAGVALKAAAQAWADPDAEIARRRASVVKQTMDALAPVLPILRKLPFGARVKGDDSMKEALSAIDAALERLPAAAPEILAVLLKPDGDARAFGRHGSAANWKGIAPPLAEVREILTDAAQTLSDGPEVFDLDEAHERRVGEALLRLSTVFDAVLAAYAQECAGRLDFLDLELKTLELLRSDQPCVDEIISGARYLLIDEFQDTNPTQAALFELLLSRHHSPGRLFAVGDAKQSIYGFRGSDVAVFNAARETIPARNGALHKRPQALPYAMKCADDPLRRSGVISLDVNYRSRPQMLEIGNQLFERILGGRALRNFDAPPQRLSAPEGEKDEATSPAVELHLLKAAKRNDDDDARRADDEAELCAQLAQRLKDEGLNFKDIAILVRRGTRNAQFRAAFDRHGIPLLLAEQGGLLQTQEALDCINLLRVIVDIGDDVAALGLLRSPFCGLSDVVLTEIGLATREQKRPLIDRIRESTPQRPEDATAHRRFFEMLAALAERADWEPPSGLLLRAFGDCGYALAVGSGPQAEQRLANLERMLDVIREIQRESPGLAAVCRELRRRQESDEDDTQGMPEGDADGVRLMTIHKSKGMEFPAVIVPDLGREPRLQETGIVRAWPALGESLGLNLRQSGGDEAGEYRPDLAAWRAVNLRRERDLSEEKRVLYVAFTRAEQRLLLVGTVRENSRGLEAKSSWSEQILGALNCPGYGHAPGVALPGLRVNWVEGVARAKAVSSEAQRKQVTLALQIGLLPLSEPLEDRLVAPIAQSRRGPEVFAPKEVEVGVLVHAALERRLKGKGTMEIGFVFGGAREVERQAKNAETALRLRPKAIRELSEWRVFGERGGRVIERRLDLLRVLDGENYEIVDYKTDAFAPGMSPQTAAQKYREQLGEYRELLTTFLASRGRKPKSVRTYICFTSPEHLTAESRVVEV